MASARDLLLLLPCLSLCTLCLHADVAIAIDASSSEGNQAAAKEVKTLDDVKHVIDVQTQQVFRSAEIDAHSRAQHNLALATAREANQSFMRTGMRYVVSIFTNEYAEYSMTRCMASVFEGMSEHCSDYDKQENATRRLANCYLARNGMPLFSDDGDAQDPEENVKNKHMWRSGAYMHAADHILAYCSHFMCHVKDRLNMESVLKCHAELTAERRKCGELLDASFARFDALLASCDARVASCEARVDELGKSCEARVEELGKSCEARVEVLDKSCEARVEELGKSCEARVEVLDKSCEARVEELGKSCEARVEELGKSCDGERAKCASCEADLKSCHDKTVDELLRSVTDATAALDQRNSCDERIEKERSSCAVREDRHVRAAKDRDEELAQVREDLRRCQLKHEELKKANEFQFAKSMKGITSWFESGILGLMQTVCEVLMKLKPLAALVVDVRYVEGNILYSCTNLLRKSELTAQVFADIIIVLIILALAAYACRGFLGVVSSAFIAHARMDGRVDRRLDRRVDNNMLQDVHDEGEHNDSFINDNTPPARKTSAKSPGRAAKLLRGSAVETRYTTRSTSRFRDADAAVASACQAHGQEANIANDDIGTGQLQWTEREISRAARK